MMNQFYNEGLGDLFCKRPIAFSNKKIKNKKLKKITEIVIKTIYTLLAIIFAVIMFIANFPL